MRQPPRVEIAVAAVLVAAGSVRSSAVVRSCAWAACARVAAGS